MFLATLNETQKLAYLDLSYNLIAADGMLSDDEMTMMEQYKQEMNISVPLTELSNNTDRAIAVFQGTSSTVKKQILFELVGLAYADNNYAEEERIFLEKSCAAWGLNLDDLELCKAYVTELMDLYGEIGRFVSS